MSDVDYCYCDVDDPPIFWSERNIRRARKQFRCCECGGPILPGESYREFSGKWYSEIETYRTCALCVELKEWASISVPCFCSNTFGELHERVQAMVQDTAPKVPGFFMEYGRRMIAIRRRKAAASNQSG